jgi:hypothetical protein
MIRVMIFPGDGTVICGGEELFDKAADPGVAGWIDFEGDREIAERFLHQLKHRL